MSHHHYVAVSLTVLALLAMRCGSPRTVHPSGQISTPTQHRSTSPAACPATSAMPQCSLGGGCMNDSDCVDGPNGRCITTSTCTCRYNDCVTDADCAAGSDCACEPSGGAGSSGNQSSKCVPSNCRTDDDCGPGGFCSPTGLPGSSRCGALYGWFCHTAKDECGVDTDCVSDETGAALPSCLYAPEVAHWICSTQFACAG